jgi:hypothetical protein
MMTETAPSSAIEQPAHELERLRGELAFARAEAERHARAHATLASAVRFAIEECGRMIEANERLAHKPGAVRPPEVYLHGAHELMAVRFWLVTSTEFDVDGVPPAGAASPGVREEPALSGQSAVPEAGRH